MPDDVSPPDDDLVPDAGAEDDPIPIHPIDPPPFPPPGPPPPPPPPPPGLARMDTSGGAMGYAVYSAALRTATTADAVQKGLSAEYVTVPVALPLNEKTQTAGNFEFAVTPVPEQSDNKHYLVTVYGQVGVVDGNFILLALNLPSPDGEQPGQIGASLGKLVILPQ